MIEERPLLFHPQVLARGKAGVNKYMLTLTGEFGNIKTYTIAWMEKGKPDPNRTYEFWVELIYRFDTDYVFAPLRCWCPDSTCRGRGCKHCVIWCLWMDIPIASAAVSDKKRQTNDNVRQHSKVRPGVSGSSKADDARRQGRQQSALQEQVRGFTGSDRGGQRGAERERDYVHAVGLAV